MFFFLFFAFKENHLSTPTLTERVEQIIEGGKSINRSIHPCILCTFYIHRYLSNLRQWIDTRFRQFNRHERY